MCFLYWFYHFISEENAYFTILALCYKLDSKPLAIVYILLKTKPLCYYSGGGSGKSNNLISSLKEKLTIILFL